MKEAINRKVKSLCLLAVTGLVLSLTGCGGGGNLSNEVVSGVAAVGAPLSGQVALKDSSDQPREKVAQIDQNGAFAFDVTGMTPPYMLQAKGSAGGTAYQLHSFARNTGTANVNPLSNVIVANAAGAADPAAVFADSDDQMEHVAANLSAATSRVMTTLQPLLSQYGAAGVDPITSPYSANHQNMDLMFDQMKITLSGGTMTIVNNQSGSVICSGSVTDWASITVNSSGISPVPAPTSPTGMTAMGGTGQIGLTWNAVSGATSYNVYYGSSSSVSTATGTKVSVNATSYLHTGLAAGTTYYYLVTAVNGSGESAPSATVHAMTTQVPPAPTAPAPPTGVTAAGGTNQVTLTWPAVTWATSYNIYWSSTSGVTTATGTKLANATSPAVHTGLTAGTTYYYVVTAVNSAGESAASAQASATTSAAVVLDGLALYNQYCYGCHGTAKMGKTATAIQGAIAANTGGMGSLSSLTAEQIAAIATTTAPTVAPPPACGSCHAIPPATGHHSFHTFAGCATCHGTGYSSTTVNSATHNNGVKNLVTTIGWNATTRTCSNACHGTRTW